MRRADPDPDLGRRAVAERRGRREHCPLRGSQISRGSLPLSGPIQDWRGVRLDDGSDMSDLHDLLTYATARAADYRQSAVGGSVFPSDVDFDAVRPALGSLPDGPTPAAGVIQQLADIVEPALVATTGPRYFGFVIGGALDAATAADVLTTGWDQNAFNAVTSPAAALVEDVTGGWLKDILGLPARSSFGFVTGGQGANKGCLAAARRHVLAEAAQTTVALPHTCPRLPNRSLPDARSCPESRGRYAHSRPLSR